MTASAVTVGGGGSQVTAVGQPSAVVGAGTPGAVSAAGATGGIAAAAAPGSIAAQGSGTSVGQIGGVSQPGGAPPVLALVAAPIAPVAGVLALDMSQANTFRVTLNQSVTAVALTGFPAPGQSERVTVYFAQDSAGNRTVSGWPGVRWSDGEGPQLSPAPGAVDCVVLDVLDGGATIFGNLVGLAYT